MATTPVFEPPRPAPPRFGPQSTRWEKEKAAAGNAFDFPEDPKVIGFWAMGETVGKGASGRVRIARHTRTGKVAAAKIIPAKEVAASRASLAAAAAKAEKQRMGIEREILMMKLMDHPNIMRLYDVWESDKDLYLILEYVEGGELFDYLVNRGKLPVAEALNYFKQIIAGLHYCHSFSIIHRDLKPENILLTGPNLQNIKIADWGMATLQLPSNQLETSCGSPHYASPEIVNGQKYEGAPSDIWSCGVILFALLAGRLPFDDKNVRALLDKVRVGKFAFSSSIEPRARDLISRMLVVDSSKRITMAEILQHPFMQMDTPGIGPSLPPPPALDQEALMRPIPPNDICETSFQSLMVIWRDKVTQDTLFAALTSPGRNFMKSIYYLLLRYKERSMEEYNMNEDYDGSARPHTQPLMPRRPAIRPAPPSQAKRASAVPSPTPGRPRSGSRPKSHRPKTSVGSAAAFASPQPPTPQLPRIKVASPERMSAADRAGLKSPISPTSPARPKAPVTSTTALGFIIPPVVHDPVLQQTIDNLAEQINTLVPKHNAQQSSETVAVAAPSVKRRETMPAHEGKENVRTKSTMGPPEMIPAHALAAKRKDDDMPGAYHTMRRSTMPAGTPASPALSSATAHGVSSSSGREAGSSGGDRRKSKHAPPPLDLSVPPGKHSRHSNMSMPSPLPSPFLATPVVSEFRGWFTNLFNWKAQTYQLQSRENCLISRDIAAKILMPFGVICGLEDIEGWGVLRCKIEETLDSAGNAANKGVRFRIEFAPTGGQPNCPYESIATLVLEKGALSAFKSAYQYLKANWTLDTLPARTSGEQWIELEKDQVAAPVQ